MLLPFLAGRFFRRSRTECAALLLGGFAPDQDIFLMWIPQFINTSIPFTHRGITHNFIFGFVTIAIFLFIASRKSVKSFLKSLLRTDIVLMFKPGILLIAYLGVLSHLFLDWLTTYRIPLFYPFSREAYAAELFFRIDLYLMVLSASLIIYAVFMISKTSSSLAEKKIFMDRIYMNMLIVFVSAVVLLGAVRYYEKSISLETFNQYEASAYPTSSPFEWRVYDKSGGKVYIFDSAKKEIISEYDFSGTNPNSYSFMQRN